jgi:hypothetical protein
MSDRAYWHTDPDALIADAAQALQAKEDLAAWLGCRWEYVDANLGEVLLETVKRLPERERRRRQEDQKVLQWIARLIGEISADDPYRTQVLRRLRQII